jgi:hypothetical protein
LSHPLWSLVGLAAALPAAALVFLRSDPSSAPSPLYTFAVA